MTPMLIASDDGGRVIWYTLSGDYLRIAVDDKH